MGDDVEVRAEGLELAVIAEVRAELQEAEARLRVVEVREQGDLQPIVVASEVPRHGVPEVALPDIENETHGTEGMRRLELRRSRIEVVEMPLFIRLGRRLPLPPPRRKVKMNVAPGPSMEAVGARLADGIDDEHSMVRRSRTEAPDRRGNPDRLGLPLGIQERGLWEEPELGALIYS